MKNTLSLRCAAAVAALTMTSIGLAPTAFAADPPATTSPVGAISGSWGSGCKTITVNSGGWAAGDQVHVRWYGSATKATPGVDGETYVPAGQPWSQTVDPTKVRGFSFRIVDAAGNYRTPLKEQAASCIVVTGPAITAVRDDCDTVHVAVTNSSRRIYQVSLRSATKPVPLCNASSPSRQASTPVASPCTPRSSTPTWTCPRGTPTR